MKRFVVFLALMCASIVHAACSQTAIICARPAGNTGTGFFVDGSKLYDPTGVEFRIRGVNQAHRDNPGAPTGIPRSGANTNRMAVSFALSSTANLSNLKAVLDAGVTPMPGSWLGTCKSDSATLASIVDNWVAQAPVWTTLNATGLVNIANEWGAPNSAAWRDGYIVAIARMRAAGYLMPLVIDSGGCGQDAADVLKYGAEVLASDPQKNVIFDEHVYGVWKYPTATSWQQDYTKSMAALKSTGLPIIVGEFGPGRNIGPSPTMLTPEKIISDAESNGFGWLAWAWDDNNLAACAADDGWFAMTTKCGRYTGQDATELTEFGRTVVPLFKATGAELAHLH